MNRKVLLFYLVMILCLVSSVSVTAAWYVDNRNLYVKDFDIGFNGDKEVKIGTTEEEFYEDIPSSDILEVEGFVPVSSMYSYKWLEQKKTTPEFRQSYSSLTTESEMDSGIAKKGFYSQEFYLYSERNVIVSLAEETKVEPNVKKNLETAKKIKDEYPDLSQDKILDNLNSIANSLRISILVPDENYYSYFIIDPKKDDEKIYFVGRLDNNADGYYDFKAGKERLFGEYEEDDIAKIVYKDENVIDSELSDTTKMASAFNAKTRKGIKAIDWKKTLENGFEPVEEKSLTVEEASNTMLVPLVGLKPQKIIISIYLEGWDLDNTDITRLGSFSADIKFKVLR